MTARTKGDLCGLGVREETEYGVIGSGATAYAGTTLTLSDRADESVEGITGCGSRADIDSMTTGIGAGYSATFNVVEGKGWEDWIERAVGSLDGVARDLPSFDTAVRVDPSTVHLWTGCKVNSLGMSAASIGAKIEFSAEVVARWHTMTPFEDSDGDALEMDTAPIPSGIPVRYNRLWEYSTNGTSYTKIPAQSWSLSISSNLASEPGISDPDGGIQLDAGEGSTPQDSTITLDLVIQSKDSTWDALRMALTKGLTFRITIDGKVLTLTGCRLGLAGPDRSATGPYTETIAVTALDLSVV